MPLSFRDATIQPIPKGSKDPSLSANYRGIALASSLSKVMEWSILLTWELFFTTSDLQFGFKSGFSTTLCTGVLKAVINRYLNNGSKVYACLIDASIRLLIWLTTIFSLISCWKEVHLSLLYACYCVGISLSNYAFVGWGDLQSISRLLMGSVKVES